MPPGVAHEAAADVAKVDAADKALDKAPEQTV